MNRVGVFTAIATDLTVTNTAGLLTIVASNGTVLATGATGPFVNPTMVDVLVGLNDGSIKEVITINPRDFTFKTLAYVAAVGKTVRVGYDGTSNKLIIVDPTIVNNLNKYGTLTIWHNDPKSAVAPAASVHQDVQIISGDTVTTLYTKLQAAGTALATKINAIYGAGSVTFTSGAPVLNAASSYLQFVFAKNKEFNVTLDGIFDGTTVAVTAGTTGPFVSGLTGVEVQELEKEAAILDGYNPTQNDKRPSFDIVNYVAAVGATNYDATLIKTTLPHQYESVGNPKGWDVTALLYTPNTTPGTIGSAAAALTAILNELKQNHGSLDVATAKVLFAAHA